MSNREVTTLYPALATSDGAGVRLKRALGQSDRQRMDPFLMMDNFSSDEAADYIAGFPDHPHRGFETITYMLDGHMLHQDHMGNKGHLRAGDVQWMTAGRGVIHSEMPQQEAGRMRGFQIWLNLPAADKMQPARYQDIPAGQLARMKLAEGGELILIAGSLMLDGQQLAARIQSEQTRPLIADIRLAANQSLTLPVPAGLNALAYGFEGSIRLGETLLPNEHTALLGPGDHLQLQAGEQGGRLLLLAGKALHEPVVQYGPFVMNSAEEIERAIMDYRAGKLV